MSKWAALTGSNRAVFGASVAIMLLAIVAGNYFSDRAVQVPADLNLTADPAQTGTQSNGEVATTKVDEEPQKPKIDTASNEATDAIQEATEPKIAPSIDEVRMEADGLAVIAGRAAPGSRVSVIVDGEENTEVTTDPSGSFAAVTVITTKTEAQELTIVQSDGKDEIVSLGQVILAPSQTIPATVEDTQKPKISDRPQGGGDQSENTAAVEPRPSEQTAALDLAEVTHNQAGQLSAAASDATQAESSDDSVAETVPDEPLSKIGMETTKLSEMAAIDADDPKGDASQPVEETVTVLKSTADGVEVLSDRQPRVLDNIAIDTISYSDAGDVQLAGRAQSDTKAVRVYIDNSRVVDLAVDPDGNWRGDLPTIDTGVYTLRVDEVDSSGEVTSRVETPFKREDPQLLAAADDVASIAKQITVQTGNTLWAIARDRYGEGRLYVQVFEANRESIRDPDLIYPGQVFNLPDP